MAIMMNPAAEMSQVRSQQTLAMTADSAAAATPATASVAPAASGAAGQAAAAAATPGAAGDAGMGAAAVQEPDTKKIVLQSVLKGAMSGASVGLGVKSFAPFLSKIPFLAKMVGTVGGAGLLGFLGKIPVLGKLLPMIAPKMAGPLGFLIAAGIGAAVGAIGGLIKGKAAAKKAQEEYAAAQAAAAQQPAPTPTPAPTEPAPADQKPPAKAKAAKTPRFKSWVVARHGSSYGTQKFGSYTTKGESMKDLCARFHTTPAEIRKLNPSLTGDTVPSGTKLKLARKVVPDAKAWKA